MASGRVGLRHAIGVAVYQGAASSALHGSRGAREEGTADTAVAHPAAEPLRASSLAHLRLATARVLSYLAALKTRWSAATLAAGGQSRAGRSGWECIATASAPAAQVTPDDRAEDL